MLEVAAINVNTALCIAGASLYSVLSRVTFAMLDPPGLRRAAFDVWKGLATQSLSMYQRYQGVVL